MDNGFSVLMMIFGGAILFYAGLLTTGNPKLLPFTVQPTLRKKDKKSQVRHIAAITAAVGVPFLLGGFAGQFWGDLVCLIVMGALGVLLIIIALIPNKNKGGNPDEDNEEK